MLLWVFDLEDLAPLPLPSSPHDATAPDRLRRGNSASARARTSEIGPSRSLPTSERLNRSIMSASSGERFTYLIYHLARTVPSVDNLYILLWTALEAVMGLRTDQPDIEIVQTNVAQAIVLGSVGRRVNSTVQRLRTLSRANNWSYLGPAEANEYDLMGLCRWIVWLIDKSVAKSQDDPFLILKADPLLAKQYRTINETWGDLGVLRELVSSSERNLRYQLDRLYLTRNTIIHSGHFGRTGAYQWIHLEWYVGKILAQAISTLDQLYGQLQADPRDLVFGELQGQYRSTVDYLRRHSSESITLDHLIVSGVTRFPTLCF
jgi:hypothetical protein